MQRCDCCRASADTKLCPYCECYLCDLCWGKGWEDDECCEWCNEEIAKAKEYNDAR